MATRKSKVALSKTQQRSRNSRKGRRAAKGIPLPYPSEWEDFILKYKLYGGIRRAAVHCHISTSTAMRILRDERTPEIMKRLEEELLRKKIELAAERFLLDEADVDEAMLDILKNGQTHERMGDEARVNAGIALYKRMKLIEPARIVNNNNAQAAALASESPKQLPYLFQSAWRTSMVEAQTFGPEHQLQPEVGSSEPSPRRLPGE